MGCLKREKKKKETLKKRAQTVKVVLSRVSVSDVKGLKLTAQDAAILKGNSEAKDIPQSIPCQFHYSSTASLMPPRRENERTNITSARNESNMFDKFPGCRGERGRSNEAPHWRVRNTLLPNSSLRRFVTPRPKINQPPRCTPIIIKKEPLEEKGESKENGERVKKPAGVCDGLFSSFPAGGVGVKGGERGGENYTSESHASPPRVTPIFIDNNPPNVISKNTIPPLPSEVSAPVLKDASPPKLCLLNRYPIISVEKNGLERHTSSIRVISGNSSITKKKHLVDYFCDSCKFCKIVIVDSRESKLAVKSFVNLGSAVVSLKRIECVESERENGEIHPPREKIEKISDFEKEPPLNAPFFQSNKLKIGTNDKKIRFKKKWREITPSSVNIHRKVFAVELGFGDRTTNYHIYRKNRSYYKGGRGSRKPRFLKTEKTKKHKSDETNANPEENDAKNGEVEAPRVIVEEIVDRGGNSPKKAIILRLPPKTLLKSAPPFYSSDEEEDSETRGHNENVGSNPNLNDLSCDPFKMYANDDRADYFGIPSSPQGGGNDDDFDSFGFPADMDKIYEEYKYIFDDFPEEPRTTDREKDS